MPSIKQIIRHVAAIWPLGREWFADARRYFRFSDLTNSRIEPDKNLSALILAHCHSIERAFSLRNTRAEFGRVLFSSLGQLMERAAGKEQFKFEMDWAEMVSASYLIHHDKRSDKPKRSAVLGYCHASKTRLTPFEDVFNTRHSVRNFDSSPPRTRDVLRAIRLAKAHTPSVCNRQGYKGIWVRSSEMVQRVLAVQSGNDGIEDINSLLVICADLTCFFGINERRQPYIDAGIFLMNLLLCLHYHNIATCTLNWTTENSTDDMLRKLLKLHESLVPVAIIALGRYKEEACPIDVPRSPRKPLRYVLEIRDV